MIFDTDVLVWIERGDATALVLAENEPERFISAWTHMELLQGARDRRQQQTVAEYLREFDFTLLPLSEGIGHRATDLLERYALSHGLRAGDALVAATAIEHQQTLCTGNARHFRPIKELKLKAFKH